MPLGPRTFVGCICLKAATISSLVKSFASPVFIFSITLVSMAVVVSSMLLRLEVVYKASK